jgi:hypothetical protein
LTLGKIIPKSGVDEDFDRVQVPILWNSISARKFCGHIFVLVKRFYPKIEDKY